MGHCIFAAQYLSGKPPQQLPNLALPKEKHMRKNTILWADDDSDDLQMMREILSKLHKDYQLVEARNGKEALDYLRKAKQKADLPCLIILDINMPVLDGKETLSIIKQSPELCAVPVVVFTTSDSELDKMFCQKYQTEMITKPPSYTNLEAAVSRLLKFCIN
jgi:CheY-like chemotaxis protein